MRIQITILKSDSGFHLYAVGGYCGIQPAGPRLLRKDPPDIQFKHTDEKEAQKDADKLQAHLDEWFNSKEQKKTSHARTFN